MSIVVADYFDDLVKRWNSSSESTDLSKSDRIIFHIICVRCEIDINGFDSIFEQLLTEKEYLFFMEALSELKEEKLYSLFMKVYSRLTKIDYFKNDELSMSTFSPEEVAGLLKDLGNEIVETNLLWELDEKLEDLIKST